MFGLLNKAFGAITGLQKAMLLIQKDPIPIPIPVPVQFNPNSYSFSQSAVAAKPEKNSTGDNLIQFTGSKREDFTLELFFDSYESGLDVRLNPSFLAVKNLMIPSALVPLGSKPARVIFTWDALGTEDNGIIFEGYAIKLDQKFTLFLGDGTPVRATVSLTLKSAPKFTDILKFKGKNGCRKVRTVQEGERLDLLAHRTLFDPALWRELVNENSELITNPRNYPAQVHVGKTVVIPDYYDTERG